MVNVVHLELDTDVSDISFVAFDVETTGLSPVANRLVELCGVRFSTQRDSFETFSTLINTEAPIPKEVTAIHGITDDMVELAPKAKTAVANFIDWAGPDCVFMAHNADFDVEFVRVNLARAALPCPKNFVVDTLTLSREFLRDAPNHQLKTVVQHLSLPSGDYHRALADSIHVKDVFRAMSERQNLKRWRDLSENGFVSTFDYDRYEASSSETLSEEAMEVVESIRRAIEMSLPVRLEYNGQYKSKRTVQPTALIHSRGNFYLTAFCKRAQAERTFRVDRISNVKALG